MLHINIEYPIRIIITYSKQFQSTVMTALLIRHKEVDGTIIRTDTTTINESSAEPKMVYFASRFALNDSAFSIRLSHSGITDD